MISSVVVALAISVCCSTTRAALITYQTPANSTLGDKPVSAKATFTTSNGQIGILIENLQADPKSLIQGLNGILFHISTGQTTGTIGSSSGTERTINSNGTFVVGGNVATGWALTTQNTDLQLSLLNTPTAPTHILIGPPNGSNLYAAANASIKNGAHNPFLGLTANFTLNVPGVTDASSISAVTFLFNTAAGSIVTGDVPEPVAGALLACILPGLMIRRRRST